MNNLAVMLTKLDKHTEAQQLLRNTLSEIDGRVPHRHPEYLCALCNLAASLYLSGRTADANEIFLKLQAFEYDFCFRPQSQSFESVETARDIGENRLSLRNSWVQNAAVQDTMDTAAVEPINQPIPQSGVVSSLRRYLDSLSHPIKPSNGTGKMKTHRPSPRFRNVLLSLFAGRPKRHEVEFTNVAPGLESTSDSYLPPPSDSVFGSSMRKAQKEDAMPFQNLEPVPVSRMTTKELALEPGEEQGSDRTVHPLTSKFETCNVQGTGEPGPTLRPGDAAFVHSLISPIAERSYSRSNGKDCNRYVANWLTSAQDELHHTPIPDIPLTVPESSLVRHNSGAKQDPPRLTFKSSYTIETDRSSVSFIDFYPWVLTDAFLKRDIPARHLRITVYKRSHDAIRRWTPIDEFDALLDTGCTQGDVVSEEYCQLYDHHILPLAPKHRKPWVDANGNEVKKVGTAKLHVGWTGHDGSMNILREFLVVKDLPRNLMFGNNTITRYGLLDAASIMLPLLLALRSGKKKAEDRELTRQIVSVAEKQEAEQAAARAAKWEQERQRRANRVSDKSSTLVGGSDTSRCQSPSSTRRSESTRPSTGS